MPNQQQINSRPGANGATIEVVQEKEQPASSKDVGCGTEQQSGNIQESPATDANPQSKRGRGRLIIEKVKKVPENEKSHSASSKDVGRDTEQQSGNILDSAFDNLASFEDFSRFLDEQETVGNSPLALLYAMAKKISSVIREVPVKGPLIFPPELCQKEKIERMELVLNNEIKKSFYYTIIDRKGERWEREEIDRVLRYKCSIGIGENYKNFCPTLKGCKLENGKCRINGKSDHVLNHIRGQLGFRFDCFYCEGCRTANIKHFKKHYLQFHWTRGFDPVQLSEAETVNDSMTRHSIASDLTKFLTNGAEKTDVILEGKDKIQVKAHKIILSMRSKVIGAMFSHETKEKAESKIEVKDIDGAVLREMINFIYTDKVGNLEEYACDLLIAADKYDLPKLKMLCEQYLASKVTIETSGEILALADACNSIELKDKCLEFVVRDSHKIVNTDSWESQAGKRPSLFKEAFELMAKRQRAD